MEFSIAEEPIIEDGGHGPGVLIFGVSLGAFFLGVTIIQWVDKRRIAKANKVADAEVARLMADTAGMREELHYREQEAEGTRAIVGSDSMSWSFEGEYWKDAIRGFRSSIKSSCKARR